MANGNWHWQESGTAWKGVGIYHVTLTVPSREPLLGKLVNPAGHNSDGIVLCKCVAYLLNNHHQDGKGQGAIETSTGCRCYTTSGRGRRACSPSQFSLNLCHFGLLPAKKCKNIAIYCLKTCRYRQYFVSLHLQKSLIIDYASSSSALQPRRGAH